MRSQLVQRPWARQGYHGFEESREQCGEGNGTPLQYSCLIPWTEKPGGLQSMGSAKSRTRLNDFTFTFHFHALEKEMATHSRILAWRIPGMGEPGGAAVYGVAQSRARLKWLSSSSREQWVAHREPGMIEWNCWGGIATSCIISQPWCN